MESQMKSRSIRVVASLLLSSMLAGTPAVADSIGVAVGSVGSTNTVGSYTGDTIDFYIPLSEDKNGTYGVNAGTSSDRCYKHGDYYGNRQCGDGLLEMHLYFENEAPGEALISLTFTDLDLGPDMNDTSYFFESLFVFANDVELVQSVSGNPHRQQIDVNVDVGSNDLWLTLVLGTEFDFNETNYCSFRNTEEHLLASLSVSSVPEPGTMALLGLGLAGMGVSRRRVRK